MKFNLWLREVDNGFLCTYDVGDEEDDVEVFVHSSLLDALQLATDRYYLPNVIATLDMQLEVADGQRGRETDKIIDSTG